MYIGWFIDNPEALNEEQRRIYKLQLGTDLKYIKAYNPSLLVIKEQVIEFLLRINYLGRAYDSNNLLYKPSLKGHISKLAEQVTNHYYSGELGLFEEHYEALLKDLPKGWEVIFPWDIKEETEDSSKELVLTKQEQLTNAQREFSFIFWLDLIEVIIDFIGAIL